MLTYGIDVHGTLGCWTQGRDLVRSNFFLLLSRLMAAWVERGERVYIVSGPPTEIIQMEIAGLGIIEGYHYQQIISVVDYLRSKDIEMWQDSKGKWWANPEVWNSAKGELAELHGIDIIVDDQLEYSQSMPRATSFVLIEKINV